MYTIRAYQSRCDESYWVLRDCVGDEAGARVTETDPCEVKKQLRKTAWRFWPFPDIVIMKEKSI